MEILKIWCPPQGWVHPRPQDAGCSLSVILLPPALSLSLSFLAGRCPLCHLGTLSCLYVSTQEPSPGPVVSQKSLKEAVASQLHVGGPSSHAGLWARKLPSGFSLSGFLSPDGTHSPHGQISEPCCCHPAPSRSSWTTLCKTHSNSLKA